MVGVTVGTKLLWPCHYLNTLQYSAALIEAGIQFDTQIYTNKDHHIRGCNTRHHLYIKVCNFFLDKLK